MKPVYEVIVKVDELAALREFVALTGIDEAEEDKLSSNRYYTYATLQEVLNDNPGDSVYEACYLGTCKKKTKKEAHWGFFRCTDGHMHKYCILAPRLQLKLIDPDDGNGSILATQFGGWVDHEKGITADDVSVKEGAFERKPFVFRLKSKIYTNRRNEEILTFTVEKMWDANAD